MTFPEVETSKPSAAVQTLFKRQLAEQAIAQATAAHWAADACAIAWSASCRFWRVRLTGLWAVLSISGKVTRRSSFRAWRISEQVWHRARGNTGRCASIACSTVWPKRQTIAATPPGPRPRTLPAPAPAPTRRRLAGAPPESTARRPNRTRVRAGTAPDTERAPESDPPHMTRGSPCRVGYR